MLISQLGMTKAQFEKIAGLSNGFVDKTGANTRKSSLDKISIAFPSVNINWLLTGEGEIFKTAQGVVQNAGHIINNSGYISSIDSRQYYSDSPDILRAEIDKLDRIIAEKENRIAEKDKQIAEKDKQIAALIAAISK